MPRECNGLHEISRVTLTFAVRERETFTANYTRYDVLLYTRVPRARV